MFDNFIELERDKFVSDGFGYNGLGGFLDDGKEQLGVIAQQIEKAAPSLIKKRSVILHPGDSEKTIIKAVDYGSFVYVLINAVKDFYHKWFDDSVVIHREIATIKKENEELRLKDAASEREIKELKARLDKIETMLKSKK